MEGVKKWNTVTEAERWTDAHYIAHHSIVIQIPELIWALIFIFQGCARFSIHFSPQYQFLAFFLTALIFWFFFIKEKEQQNVGNGAIESLRIKSDLLNFISIAQAAGLRNCNGAVIGLFSKQLRMFWNCFASLATQPNKGAFCNYWWKVRVFGEEMKIIKMYTQGRLYFCGCKAMLFRFVHV